MLKYSLMNRISKNVAKEIIDDADCGTITVAETEDVQIIGQVDIEELDVDVELQTYKFE